MNYKSTLAIFYFQNVGKIAEILPDLRHLQALKISCFF